MLAILFDYIWEFIVTWVFIRKHRVRATELDSRAYLWRWDRFIALHYFTDDSCNQGKNQHRKTNEQNRQSNFQLIAVILLSSLSP